MNILVLGKCEPGYEVSQYQGCRQKGKERWMHMLLSGWREIGG